MGRTMIDVGSKYQGGLTTMGLPDKFSPVLYFHFLPTLRANFGFSQINQEIIHEKGFSTILGMELFWTQTHCTYEVFMIERLSEPQRLR